MKDLTVLSFLFLIALAGPSQAALSETDVALDTEFKRLQQVALSEFVHQEYSASLAHNRKLFEIASKITDESTRYHGQRWALMQMAQVYGVQGQYKYSIDTYHLLIDCDRKADPLSNYLETDFKDLAEVCKKAGKHADAAKYMAESRDMPVKRDRRYKTALAQMKAKGEEQERQSQQNKEEMFIQSLEEAENNYGKNSRESYFPKRSLAFVYLEHRKLSDAEPLFADLVAYSDDRKNYFDSGKEWDKRRKMGIPMSESQQDANGRMVLFIDNRRPSSKIDRNDLFTNLMVLSEIKRRLGDAAASAQLLQKAKRVYQDSASRVDNDPSWRIFSKTSPYNSFATYQNYVVSRYFKK